MVLHLVLFLTKVTLQLTDNDLVIGDQTRKALACLNPAKQKLVILGIRAYYSATVSHLQLRLPPRQ